MIQRRHSSAKLGYRVALYSPDERYRYALTITWEDTRPSLTCCGLNPSVATETADDRTIAKMIRLAKRWGHGSLTMLNLFAFRSTNPKVMMRAEDPVGPENTPEFMVSKCGRDFLCAWGKDGNFNGRADFVTAALRRRGQPLFYLRMNGDGSPAHPLYLPETNLKISEWI